ncbi:unnamed protein product [Urochloa humidicola]
MMHPSHNGQQVFHKHRAESSGAYVEDDDLREVPPSEVAKGKGKKKKLSNFKPEEDIIVVKTWLEISCDPITSTGQKRDRLWERIHERLEEVRCHNQSLLECEQEKIRIMREQQVMERKMAARRRRKEVNEEDERILAVDLNACTPAQRVYFEDRQQQILDKIEARRRKRQQADP